MLHNFNSRKAALSLALIVSLNCATAAFADFNGTFTGAFAPANWSGTPSGNGTFDGSTLVLNNSSSLTVIGATGGGNSPVTPYSVFDYSITLPGTGPENVDFYYSFSNPAGFAGNTAALYDGLLSTTPVATLTSSSYAAVVLSGVFAGGDVLDFRLTSVNANIADVLEVTSIPAPESSSTLWLMGFGVAACFAPLWLRKSARA